MCGFPVLFSLIHETETDSKEEKQRERRVLLHMVWVVFFLFVAGFFCLLFSSSIVGTFCVALFYFILCVCVCVRSLPDASHTYIPHHPSPPPPSTPPFCIRLVSVHFVLWFPPASPHPPPPPTYPQSPPPTHTPVTLLHFIIQPSLVWSIPTAPPLPVKKAKSACCLRGGGGAFPIRQTV